MAEKNDLDKLFEAASLPNFTKALDEVVEKGLRDNEERWPGDETRSGPKRKHRPKAAGRFEFGGTEEDPQPPMMVAWALFELERGFYPIDILTTLGKPGEEFQVEATLVIDAITMQRLDVQELHRRILGAASKAVKQAAVQENRRRNSQ